ncbi:DUF4019 domain-containing protein [Luteimonas sp. Y-2-2-4F]|nr:DUF4019 domain-containing protein [Luteimonas sp. Y-2-2-4F]MCD9032307.1 DUF4019 domain-containing protein [Luteimonas sp. Y-2-2-4F]
MRQHKTSKRVALGAAIALLAGGAFAQQPAPQAPPAPARPQAAQPPAQQQPTPEQREQLARQDAEITRAAQQVVQLIDANRAGEVWDMATARVKGLIPRDTFVQEINRDRNRLGAPSQRGQAVVSRSQFEAGGQVPEGLYLNVAFPTRFANNAEPVRELVSFRLDEDRVWRVSGYSLR